MRQENRVAWTLGALGILLFSLSCATGGGPRSLQDKPANESSFTMTGSSLVYDYGRGRVDFATTDIQDVYENGVIDLLRSPDPQVRQLLDRIPIKGEFHVVVVNGQNSPGSLIQINDEFHFAREYSKRSKEFATGLDVPFGKYSLHKKSGAKALRNLKLHLLDGVEVDPQYFISTNQICVEANTPGPNGEYRNGALTIQLIETNTKESRLLAEFSVFRESELTKCR